MQLLGSDLFEPEKLASNFVLVDFYAFRDCMRKGDKHFADCIIDVKKMYDD